MSANNDYGKTAAQDLRRMYGIPNIEFDQNYNPFVKYPNTPPSDSALPPPVAAPHAEHKGIIETRPTAFYDSAESTLERIRATARERQKRFYAKNKDKICADKRKGYSLLKASRETSAPSTEHYIAQPTDPVGPKRVIDGTAQDLHTKMEAVYLLQEREFVRSGEPVYKIGRTTQVHTKRISQYPKGSTLILMRACIDCRAVEAQIKALFKSKYAQERDIGIEYFRGDEVSMIDDINRIVAADAARSPESTLMDVVEDPL